MKTKVTIIIVAILFLAILALCALFVGTHSVVVLDPKGMIADKQRRLIITAALLMLIVVVPVLIMVFVFVWRYGAQKDKAKYSPDWGHSNVAEAIWWGVPFMIITVLAIITWRTSHELNPFKPIESDKKPLEIQVVALQWKWLFIYPEQGIATVNFVQFPENTPLNFEITGDAPMNSFWIPQLGGQIYAMPSMRTKLHLIADTVGEFEGRSANLSGTGFAGMVFTAKSTTDEDFDSWVRTVKNSGRSMNRNVYDQLVEPSSYVPVMYYQLTDEDLFDQVVLKYSAPEKVKDRK
ncbi:ubiquinol oxidase subunit II [Candidatus Aerophobetes bacterium]|uniref:Ubiquinol oxidase polypeptide II n=1 Tax=Aerophobetes bacterium TaxID=2030807 RepID=A0A2A4YFU5_UNCAE|nr:MAG: ubiquinol oxidase subunit II [Candidatus Aerophobetes bacterium]